MVKFLLNWTVRLLYYLKASANDTNSHWLSMGMGPFLWAEDNMDMFSLFFLIWSIIYVLIMKLFLICRPAFYDCDKIRIMYNFQWYLMQLYTNSIMQLALSRVSRFGSSDLLLSNLIKLVNFSNIKWAYAT